MTRGARAGSMVLLAILLGCASAAYRSGAADATADIVRGDPHLVIIGMPNIPDHVVDRDTGLPLKWRGCQINDDAIDYCDGYNDRVGAALASGRLPPPRLREKLYSKEQVVGWLRPDDVRQLRIGGPGVEVPAGPCAGVIRVRPHTLLGEAEGQLVLSPAGRGAAQVLLAFARELRVRLIDDNTTLLVHFPALRRYYVIDLAYPIVVAGYRQ